MRGWANYFSRGYPRGAYWELDWYLRWRFMRHLRRRGQHRFRPPKDEPWYSFFQRQGLLELNRSHYSRPAHAQGESLLESRMREIRTSGSTRGEVTPTCGTLPYSTASNARPSAATERTRGASRMDLLGKHEWPTVTRDQALQALAKDACQRLEAAHIPKPLFQMKDEPEGERRSSCGLRGIIA